MCEQQELGHVELTKDSAGGRTRSAIVEEKFGSGVAYQLMAADLQQEDSLQQHSPACW